MEIITIWMIMALVIFDNGDGSWSDENGNSYTE